MACYHEDRLTYSKKYGAKQKEYQQRNRENLMWLGARARARKDGREFNLARSDIVIPTHCPVSGKPMERPSLDRIDNSKGYVLGNVAVISHRMNSLKRNATIEEIRGLLRYMEQNEAAIELVG